MKTKRPKRPNSAGRRSRRSSSGERVIMRYSFLSCLSCLSCPPGFFLVLSSCTRSKAVAVASTSSLPGSPAYGCLSASLVKKMSRGPVSTRRRKLVSLSRSVSRILRSVSCSTYRRPAGTVGRSLDSAIWPSSARAAPSRSPASCGGASPMRASWTELRALASRYSSRCLEMADSASRMAALPSWRSLMSLSLKTTKSATATVATAVARTVTQRFSRGPSRSHSPTKKPAGRRASRVTDSRRLLSTLMIVFRSRALGGDVEGELLAAVRDLGDGALGHLLEAVDLLQLGGDLVDGGGRVGGPLHEGLLGANLQLRDVQLDLVGRRHLARDLIEQVEGRRLGQRGQVLAEPFAHELGHRLGIVAWLAEQLLRLRRELLVQRLALRAEAGRLRAEVDSDRHHQRRRQHRQMPGLLAQDREVGPVGERTAAKVDLARPAGRRQRDGPGQRVSLRVGRGLLDAGRIAGQVTATALDHVAHAGMARRDGQLPLQKGEQPR